MSSAAERVVEAADRVNDPEADAEMGGTGVDDAPPPQKKKQKRNKPTLSCVECVERKTKTRSSKIKKDKKINSSNDNVQPPPSQAEPPFPGLPSPSTSFRRSGSSSSTNSSPFLLSNLQHTRQVSVSVFGSGTQHPFANYWTTSGGVPEVIGVLPSKEQADSLVTKYFESVDPVYPMINKAHFLADYDRFWALSLLEKQKVDPSMLGLHYAVYAMGAQFVQLESQQTRAQIAEFYVSAAHQSLRLYPYLSRTSLRTIQAMVLMQYFLMNDNKPTDAWAFGGLISRQAYAMGLNRNPSRIVPEASLKEKNQRCKTWQAVYFQDTFFAVLLKLPPTTSFTDCTVDNLRDEPIDPHLPASQPHSHQSYSTQPPQKPQMPSNQTPMLLSPLPINTNPMSISNIAPRHTTPPPSRPHPGRHTDIDYTRCMWRMADLVQTHLCISQSLSKPYAASSRERSALLSRFHALYASFPPSLTTTARSEFAVLLTDGGRMARQNLFLRSNFWHCVMLVEADESEEAGYSCNVHGALEAGRTAVRSFFDFWDLLRSDAGVWWVFQHRAFEEALTMSNLLAAYGPPAAGAKLDPLFLEAKQDVQRMLDIVELVGSAAPEMKKTRTEALRQSLENIQW